MSSDLIPVANAADKISKTVRSKDRTDGRYWLGLRVLVALLLASVASLTLSCTRKSASDEKVVNLAIWANYLSPEMQEKFTTETGIKLRVSNYSSSEELLAKLQSGASGIDVAVPSDYMVGVMIKLGLLEPIEAEKVPNRAGLDPALLKLEFDPTNTYSIPYSWIVTGIGINRDLFKGKVDSWKSLLAEKELTGKFSLLDDVRETTAAALRANGASINTTSADELKTAEALLKDVRGRVKMFTSDVIDPLVKKEVAVAQGYSSDILQAAKNSANKIEFVLPTDGGSRALDNLVVVKGSQHAREAHELINFLLKPEVNAVFVKTIMGGPVVLKTKELLPKDLQSNPILYPPADRLKSFEYLRDLGEATRLYDRLWTEVRAR